MIRSRGKYRAISVLLVSGLTLSGCESLQPYKSETLAEQYRSVTVLSDPDAMGQPVAETAPATVAEPPARPGEVVYKGTDRFVRMPEGAPQPADEPGDITLNFENTDIREVVKVILGDLLQVNYVVDPAVQGGVTMQTGRPLNREALLPTLETLLRMNGAAVVTSRGLYRVVPVANAMKGALTPQLAGSSKPIPAGYGVQVVPLRYIGATEMSKILEPLVGDGNVVRVDSGRNLLVIAGAGRELEYIMEAIDTFDVDWIAGMSVGFFQLQFADVESVTKHIDTILGAGGGEMFDGLIKVVPIESANGLLVVTQRSDYLEKLRLWIKRLDNIEENGGAEPRLFVYRVQNGEAETLAALLNDLFAEGGGARQVASRRASVAPGFTAKETRSDKEEEKEGEETPQAAARAAAAAAARDSLTGGELDAPVRVVADVANNSLLVMATPRDYQRISDVLKDLDIVPLQVHIEATIVEVLLNGDLEYGIQWMFDASHGNGRRSEGLLDLGDAGLGPIVPGFSWTLIDNVGNIKAVLNAFAGDNRVNVLSAPSVMVLDNYTARIRVGDQVPVKVGETTETSTTAAYDYRDTGVLLSVKPRVNPGGLVIMEVSQEVSEAVETESSGLDSPTIQNRNIESTVAVQSGQSVVLGGLIRDKQEEGQSGIPGLYSLPVVGSLFGTTANFKTRTELVVVLTPRVIANAADARKITQDFRDKMKGLQGTF